MVYTRQLQLVGMVLVGIMAPVLSCPTSPQCKCISPYVHCSNLTAMPEDLSNDTVSLTIEKGTITAINNDTLRHLNKMVTLRIIHNCISVIQEGAFEDLWLRHLSLLSNNISSLPQGVFSSLKNLQELILTDNFLQSLDGVLDGLDSLTVLDVDNNQISHLTPNTFQHLKSLHHLKLHQNRITAIPEDTFVNNKFINILSLGSNPLGNVLSILPQDTQLNYINLTDCALNEFPAGLPPTLRIIRVSKNNITALHRRDLMWYQHLTAIILDENRLSYIERGTFNHLDKLEELYLFVNELQSMPGPFPKSVKNLFLDDNKITSIPNDTFSLGTKLTLLSLRNNKITSVDKESFIKLESLHRLYLEANPISTLDNAMFVFVDILTDLSLNRLHLTSIKKDCFAGLSHLQVLEMAFVKVLLEAIEGNFFTHTPYLQILDIHNSPTLAQHILSDEKIMNSLSSLEEINLMETQLKTINSNVQFFFSSLKKINLAGNFFHCNSDILWLKKWYNIEPQIFVQFSHVRCHLPHQVQGHRISELDYDLFNINDTGEDLSTLDTGSAHDMDLTTPSIPKYDYNEETNFSYEYDYDKFYKDYLNLISTTSTPSNEPTTVGLVQSTTPNKPSSGASNSARAAGIAIGMAFAVIIFMLLSSAGIYTCCKRRHGNLSHEYQGKEDYVFIVSKTEIQNDTSPKPRMTREQRGSTTSRASEDITNQTDLSMKVYTLEVDD